MAVVLHDPYYAPYAYPPFVNPFAIFPKYQSAFPVPKLAERPVLRPQADRLDRLVELAVNKINSAVRELNSLAGECDALKSQLAGADSVGERAELRAQLNAANKEIHRLRLLAIADAGAAGSDLGEFQAFHPGTLPHEFGQSPPHTTTTGYEAEAHEFAQPVEGYEYTDVQQEGGQDIGHVHEFHSQPEFNGTHESYTQSFSGHRGKQYSFFGLMVADGIKFREEYGGKHEYGAVKVVKVWGPSAVAGIAPMDFITHINRQHVASLQDFNHVVAAIEPNQQVEVIVERSNRQLVFAVHTSNTDIAPGTITHQNIVHAHLIPDEEGEAEQQQYVELRPVKK
eukprot:TRINITY_DN552_c2_g1_i1.p1 TRINITY_DN552_c2_g1~~TRINITY_DN552_c2_g1_i1.p1  ORF type:complete len:340 (-),score=33.69 TRINITY_DN552_c2_g1_i1:33-1052(-)